MPLCFVVYVKIFLLKILPERAAGGVNGVIIRTLISSEVD